MPSRRSIIQMTRDEFNSLEEYDNNIFYVVTDELEELSEGAESFASESERDEWDNWHIRLSTNAYTEIGFTNWDGSPITEGMRLYHSQDNGLSWSEYNFGAPPSLVFPFEGDYLIYFPDGQYRPIFGNNIPEHANAFTNIDFHESYLVPDLTDMFRDCRSLTTIDLAGFNAYEATDMSAMFEPPAPTLLTWEPAATYQVGDIILNDDVLYVATSPSMASEPLLNPSEWIRMDSVPTPFTSSTQERLTDKVKNKMAGISTDDIPS